VTAPAGFDPGAITNVSGSGATDFLSQIPAQFQPIFIDGFHRAITIAIANSIWLGVAASAIALIAAFGLKEIPLRRTQQSAAAQHASGAAPSAAQHASGGAASAAGAAAADAGRGVRPRPAAD
jgi:hypothetical protein